MTVRQFDPDPPPLSARHTRWFEPDPNVGALPLDYIVHLVALASKAMPLGATVDLAIYDPNPAANLVYLRDVSIEEVYPLRHTMLVYAANGYHDVDFSRIASIRLSARPLLPVDQ